jgi:hypothetical protein
MGLGQHRRHTAMALDENDTRTVTQFGLILPDSTVAWDKYQQFDLTTPEGREQLFLGLIQTAKELSFPEVVFLGHYRWTTRTLTIVDDGVFPIGEPAVYDRVNEEVQDDSEDSGGSDGADIREGSLGSPA